MKVSLNQVSKRYNFNNIFKDLSLLSEAGNSWVILGPNGSGKSTLLSIIAGLVPTSGGQISWEIKDNLIEGDQVYRYLSIAAPYLELIEDFTLEEQVRFHFRLKNPAKGLKIKEIIELSGLFKARDRKIQYFSSGMKQRLKLSLAVLTDAPLLLLDEPLSNMDKKGADWYAGLIKEFASDRTIFVCSNHQENEYFFCRQKLNIEDFQK
jgi:ABC-type multidrug transport system ATPase subunit